MDADVLIVGAGAAGLMAALELSKAGKKVLILEARERIGGRIYPLSIEEFGYEAQGGAEFVHGDAPLSKILLKESGDTFIHPTEWWNVFDGEPRITEHASLHDPMLESKLKELTKDIPIAQFFDRYFPEKEHDSLRNYIFLRTESYDAADPARASTFALREELMNEDSWVQLNIKGGYGVLLHYIEAECKKNGVEIILNKQVRAIDFSQSEIQTSVADTTIYRSSKTIITVPLSIIPQLNFIPALPQKIEAVSKIGFGPVIKVLLRFKTKWWSGAREQNFERMFFMFSNEIIPTWWTQYPEPYLTLTGWVAGPKALSVSTKSDAEILDLALSSLSNIFKVEKSQLENELITSKIVNWATDPYARGAYSYTTPESGAAIEELLKPIDDKLFFAGEGVYQGEMGGTVEAALASGKEVASKILTYRG